MMSRQVPNSTQLFMTMCHVYTEADAVEASASSTRLPIVCSLSRRITSSTLLPRKQILVFPSEGQIEAVHPARGVDSKLGEAYRSAADILG